MPSRSLRLVVFAGFDPVTRRREYFGSTVKTEPQAQIELGKLLEKARDGRHCLPLHVDRFVDRRAG